MDELIQEQLHEWLRIAAQDLAVAEHLFNDMYPRPFEAICFHCQQSAEKYLKGFLVMNDIDPPKKHDLAALVKMCGELSADFSALAVECDFLTDYGVVPRYPRKIDIEEPQVRVALNYARRIRDFVLPKTGAANETKSGSERLLRRGGIDSGA